MIAIIIKANITVVVTGLLLVCVLPMVSGIRRDYCNEVEAATLPEYEEQEKADEAVKGERFIDEEAYAEIKKYIDQIDFHCSFEMGKLAKYDSFYKEKFKQLIKGEVPFVTKSGEEVYLFECYPFYETYTWNNDLYGNFLYEYRFYDADGDGGPELHIITTESTYYVLKYHEESDSFSLWDECIRSYEHLIATKRKQNPRVGMFCTMNESGEEDFVYFVEEQQKSRLTGEWGWWYLIDIPQAELSASVAEQRINLEEGEDYFRVTERQYNELISKYDKETRATWYEEEKVIFSYEELFGSCRKQEDILDTFSKECQEEIKESAELVLKHVWPEEEWISKCKVRYAEGDGRGSGIFFNEVTRYPIFEFRRETDIEGKETFYQLSHRKQTVDGRYDIFALFSWTYEFEFLGHYAVNRETGEVIQERIKDETTGLWISNKRYRDIADKVY